MPSYTTVPAIYLAFPPISSVSNLGSEAVCSYILDVEAEINGKISKRYTVPLTVECPLLSAIAKRESIYRIAVQRALVQFPPAQQGQHPMLTQHKDDQKLLEQIAAGEIQLVNASGQAISANEATIETWSTTQNFNPTFHEGPIEDAVIDPEKLRDIGSDRGF